VVKGRGEVPVLLGREKDMPLPLIIWFMAFKPIFSITSATSDDVISATWKTCGSECHITEHNGL
jgi:hypothetical protein